MRQMATPVMTNGVYRFGVVKIIKNGEMDHE